MVSKRRSVHATSSTSDPFEEDELERFGSGRMKSVIVCSTRALLVSR